MIKFINDIDLNSFNTKTSINNLQPEESNRRKWLRRIGKVGVGLSVPVAVGSVALKKLYLPKIKPNFRPDFINKLDKAYSSIAVKGSGIGLGSAGLWGLNSKRNTDNKTK